MPATNDDKLFQFRIDPDTEVKLEEIAAATERTKSAAVRWLIQQAHAGLFGGNGNGTQETRVSPTAG